MRPEKTKKDTKNKEREKIKEIRRRNKWKETNKLREKERNKDEKETKKKEKIDAMSFGGRAHFGETQL